MAKSFHKNVENGFRCSVNSAGDDVKNMKNHTKIYGFSFLVTFFFRTFANMKKTVLFLLALACFQMLSGQTIVSNGKYIPLDTLKNRECIEAVGDFNKDGISDLAIISNMGEELGRVMAIYFGIQGGGYTCFREYRDIFPPDDDPDVSLDCSMDVNPKGVLEIDLSMFRSAGSWGAGHNTYKFRFQKGDFYLIGFDEDYFMRNTGDAHTDSYNYLTSKHQRVTYNMFDESVKKRETWSNIPKKPLRKLGSWMME